MLIKASLARVCRQPVDDGRDGLRPADRILQQGMMSRGNWLRHPGSESNDIAGATLFAKQIKP
jgi:hypothetical protein